MNTFFQGKTVLVTGHTGFKGAWLCIWLRELGAKVVGYSLEPPYPNSLFELAQLKDKLVDIRADTTDKEKLDATFTEHKPDIVMHLAAQALVRPSYDKPVETFATNVMGTINVMECVRKHQTKSCVLITSDKCYRNVEQEAGYKEDDAMSNQDPYSCSKGVTEMVVQCYRNSFNFKAATARAGNVVGGGDWAVDRIIPDTMRALAKDEPVVIRSPKSTRPWQFVLEPLSGYLLLAKKLYEGEEVSEGWNFGPDMSSVVTVKDLVELILKERGRGELRIEEDTSKKHEAKLLFLDTTKAKERINWKPRLTIQQTTHFILDWYTRYKNTDVYQLCADQIKEYEQA